jgi:hypothetical protein
MAKRKKAASKKKIAKYKGRSPSGKSKASKVLKLKRLVKTKKKRKPSFLRMIGMKR